MRAKEELPECPVATAVSLIGGKWKLLILRNLKERPCRNAYTDYQRQYESWKNACRKPDTPTHKDEKLSDKLARLQREAAENQNSISRQTKNKGAR